MVEWTTWSLSSRACPRCSVRGAWPRCHFFSLPSRKSVPHDLDQFHPHREIPTVPRRSPADDITVAAVESLIAETLLLRSGWVELAAAVVPRPGVLHTDSVLDLLTGMVESGGKRFRPRMAHWGWVAAGGQRTGSGQADLIRIGAALELLHVFALIHDDVMDSSETRRGRPSVHASARRQHIRLHGLGDASRYGENIAILAGDLAHSEADLLVASLPAPLQSLWRTLIVELMLGQGRDLVGAANGRATWPTPAKWLGRNRAPTRSDGRCSWARSRPVPGRRRWRPSNATAGRWERRCAPRRHPRRAG